MENCIFCEIIKKEIPSEPIFEDESFLVIPDKYPKAEIHILFMPKKHVHSVAESSEEDAPMMGQLLFLAKKIAQQKGISDFKLIFNNGKHADIPHMHLHLVAGNSARPLPV